MARQKSARYTAVCQTRKEHAMSIACVPQKVSTRLKVQHHALLCHKLSCAQQLNQAPVLLDTVTRVT
jgi:hypothetical protein